MGQHLSSSWKAILLVVGSEIPKVIKTSTPVGDSAPSRHLPQHLAPCALSYFLPLKQKLVFFAHWLWARPKCYKNISSFDPSSFLFVQILYPDLPSQNPKFRGHISCPKSYSSRVAEPCVLRAQALDPAGTLPLRCQIVYCIPFWPEPGRGYTAPLS